MIGLISIRQAAAAGIERLREPQWVNSLDHLKIDIVNGRPGPWLHLFSPLNKAINGRDPFDFLALKPQVDVDLEEFEPYTGPTSDSEEYRAAVVGDIASGADP